MRETIHPRPNPIIAALYTLRDLEVDVVVIHGPAGCGFMASRLIEEAGTRVVATSMRDSDLIFGAAEPLISTLKKVEEKFKPKNVAVIGTCASMIIGEDMGASIGRAGIEANVFPVDCHGCMGDNTRGAIKAVEAAAEAGIVPREEAERQKELFKAATRMEKKVGMASRDYLKPARGSTKHGVSKKIIDTLSKGGRVAVVMVGKKELAYRFADLFLAVEEARKALRGETLYVGNLDPNLGLPRIRNYATEILAELKESGIEPKISGGLDEYALCGERSKEFVDAFKPDLLVITGIPHAYPELSPDNILITDQPRQLANYLNSGFGLSVGEIASHSMVMNVHSIVPLETGDTIREMLSEDR